MTFPRVSITLLVALILGLAVAIDNGSSSKVRRTKGQPSKFQIQKKKADSYVAELGYLKDLLAGIKSPKLKVVLEAEARKNNLAAQVLALKNENMAKKRFAVLGEKIKKLKNGEIRKYRKRISKLIGKLDEEERLLKKGIEEVERAFKNLERKSAQPVVGATTVSAVEGPQSKKVPSQSAAIKAEVAGGKEIVSPSVKTTETKSDFISSASKSSPVTTAASAPSAAPALALGQAPAPAPSATAVAPAAATLAPAASVAPGATADPAAADPATAAPAALAVKPATVPALESYPIKSPPQTAAPIAEEKSIPSPVLAAPIVKQASASINSERSADPTTVTVVKSFDSQGVSTFQHGGYIESGSSNSRNESLIDIFSPARSTTAIRNKRPSKHHISKPKTIIIADESNKIKHSGKQIKHEQKSLKKEAVKASKNLNHQTQLNKPKVNSNRLINRLTDINKNIKRINDKKKDLKLSKSSEKATACLVLTEKGEKQIIKNVLNKPQNIKGDNGARNDLRKVEFASKKASNQLADIKSEKYPKLNIKTDNKLQNKLDGKGKVLSNKLAQVSSKIAKSESKIDPHKLNVKVSPVKLKYANKIADKLRHKDIKNDAHNLAKEEQSIKKGADFKIKVKQSPVRRHKPQRQDYKRHNPISKQERLRDNKHRKQRPYGSPPIVGITNA